MACVTVTTQAELDAAITAKAECIHIDADGDFRCEVSASLRFKIGGKARFSVVARGSSQPHVVARGSSQPHVVARGHSMLSIFGAVAIKAAKTVYVLLRGKGAKVKGGIVRRVKVSTPAEWCAYYGVEVKGKVAVLFKALNEDFRSPHGIAYSPGSTPVAPDWDGGKAECGGGLHFSPCPQMAREFHESATRYCACPVALKDIAVHPDGQLPQKVKAKGCCAPVWECDVDGKGIESKEKTA
jgi:hypothetical protein